jgi:Flp pilus assembly protein TadD
MSKTLFGAGFVALIAPALAAAAPVDNYATAAISAADYRTAEARLVERLKVAPADQPALLNMAYVYRHTGRTTDANTLYVKVLNRADVQLTRADGTPVSAHHVARSGLRGTVTIALR